MNIRVDLDYSINDGTEVVFRSPVDCSKVTGLILYYPDNGNTASREFAFADAHGNNVGDIDHLFAENVVVKVILDVTAGMAFVQNADTNAYLEGRLAALEYYSTEREEIGKSHDEISAEYIWGEYDKLMAYYPDNVQKLVWKDAEGEWSAEWEDYKPADGTFVNYAYVISTVDSYSDDGGYQLRKNGKDNISKPKYLVMGAIDGNERSGVFSTYRFVRDILRGHNVPQSFKEGVILNVLPVAFPWGFSTLDKVAGSTSYNLPNRFKENNVHIYYNFDCEWESQSGTSPVYGEYTAGTKAESEKETQAITKWLDDNADADLFVDYHNSGGTNEIVVILGDSSNYETDMAKKIALQGVSRVIPFWRNVIGYPEQINTSYPEGNGVWSVKVMDTIFSYSANHRVGGTANLYAQEKHGIPSIIIETPVYYHDYSVYKDNIKTGDIYHKESIAAGAEALGNILLEYYDHSAIREVTDEVNSKLDEILQAASFRVKKGSFTPSESSNTVTITGVPDNAQTVEVRAVSKLSDPVIGDVQNTSTWIVPIAYASYSSASNNHELPTGRNSFVEYSVGGRWANEPKTATKSSDGLTFTAGTGQVFEGGKTYEWTAYCWDE